MYFLTNYLFQMDAVWFLFQWLAVCNRFKEEKKADVCLYCIKQFVEHSNSDSLFNWWKSNFEN